jgi:hypothetical protein
VCCLFQAIYNCFASCFAQAPPQGNLQGYGFAWQPNTPFANFQIVALRDTDAAGLYVCVDGPTIDAPQYCFEDANAAIGIIFPIQAASNAFTQALQGLNLNLDANLQQRLEGFLKYTYNCLNYIYATNPGRQLIDGIRNSHNRVYIKPSAMGNQIQGGGDKMCAVSRTIVNLNLNIGNQERAQLMQTLAAASGQNNAQAQFQWLAGQVNGMDLYTLFEPANALTHTFLQTNRAVTRQELQDWFANGPNSQFIQQLAQAQPVVGVDLVKFLKLAVIVALYADSPAGQGGLSTVFFDVHNWSQCNIPNVDRRANTLQDRPPAIGLAHELIHAYYNAIGREPGNEFGDYSTTLAECICVGLPPWNANAITENAIRNVWPPNGVWPAAGDALNNRAVAQRTVYAAPPANQTPTSMRQNAGLGGSAI